MPKSRIQLIPKSYKGFFKEVAEKCEVHEDLADVLIRYFYKEVRRELEELNHTKINLPNLGTFNLRKARLDNAIKRHKDMLGNVEKITYRGYDAHVPIKERLDLYEDAAGRLSEELRIKKKWRDEHK